MDEWAYDVYYVFICARVGVDFALLDLQVVGLNYCASMLL